MEEQPHIAMVPSPGMGHVIPLAELAKLLVSRFNFSITLLLPTISKKPTKAQSSFLGSLPKPMISYIYLPLVDPAHLPDGGVLAPEAFMSLVHLHSLSSIRASLAQLAQRARVVALITDFFGTGLFDVARELKISPYLYFTSNAMNLMFAFHLPRLHETTSCEFRDMPDPVVLPGCVPLHGKDFEDGVQNRKDDAYRWTLHHVERYGLAEGILINTFSDLEPGVIRVLQMEDPTKPPVYPIGPVVRSELLSESDGSDCLRWLDLQPTGSVLFVSFGSGGNLSYEQLNELAIGLDISGQRFLWVVRSPSNESSSMSYFNDQNEHNPLSFLPEGFVDRTKDRCLLVPNWAPQIKVLGHASTGGFLTHCGWNSILESIVHGIPLIAWPLFAEQRMNAVMLQEGLDVALRPDSNQSGLVEAHHVAKVINDLMDGDLGKRVRSRMTELSNYAKKAMGDNGDSTNVLNKIALKWSARM